jgi:hypothetical protein
MRRLVIIGRLFKGRKTTVIDLQAYRELRQRQKEKELNLKPSKDPAEQKVPLDI